jgi:hypothetical protein
MTIHRLLAVVILAIAAPLAFKQAAAQEGEVVLFNGKDLTGWTPVLAEPRGKDKAKVSWEEVWSVKDGILIVKGRGKPSGYIRTTRDDFENYVLTLQWRFPAGTPGGNSGVLLHASTPGALGVWPKSLEAQLNHKNAGDIWVIPESTTIVIENADKRVMGRRHFNLTDDSEKPIGEWNDYEITCNGDEIIIKVNGDLVNHATKCSITKGAICLQAEGADIEFRNVRLKPLKK